MSDWLGSNEDHFTYRSDPIPLPKYWDDIQDKAAALVEEWADVVAFANYRNSVATTEAGFNQKVRRGVGGHERLMHLHERPAYRAKTRYPLPAELPLSWEAFAAAYAAANAPATPAAN